jgi:hypothetical protein
MHVLFTLLISCLPPYAGPAENRVASGNPAFEVAMPAPASDSLHLSLELPHRVAPGEPVPVILRARNVSGRALDLYLRGRTIAFDIVVSDENDEVVWRRLEDELIPAILRIETLDPGEVLEVEERWDQRSNSSDPVPPGSYRVRGLFLTEGDPLITPEHSLRIIPEAEPRR